MCGAGLPGGLTELGLHLAGAAAALAPAERLFRACLPP